jgi:hypothetical protein
MELIHLLPSVQAVGAAALFASFGPGSAFAGIATIGLALSF